MKGVTTARRCKTQESGSVAATSPQFSLPWECGPLLQQDTAWSIQTPQRRVALSGKVYLPMAVLMGCSLIRKDAC